MGDISITLRSPDDFHVHLRDGDLLRRVISHTSFYFRRALVMPNTKRPILNYQHALQYKNRIERAAVRSANEFTPLMTIKLTGNTTRQNIIDAKTAGIVAVKLYPIGVTTNSLDGVDPTRMHIQLASVFRTMEECGMVLCVHAELPGVEPMARERLFLTILARLIDNYPDLKIVVEHVSSREAVDFVKSYDRNVAATITVHHLMLTLGDVVGDKLRPHHFCKPLPKTEYDRLMLQRAAISGDKRFFFGSDSAPHFRTKKECDHGAAGVFSAPVALPCLAAIFEGSGDGWQLKLENFVSKHGAEFYGLPLNTGTVTLKKTQWLVPSRFVGIVPFKADEILEWRVV